MALSTLSFCLQRTVIRSKLLYDVGYYGYWGKQRTIAVFISAAKMQDSENKLIHSFTHSSHKYLLTTYYTLDIISVSWKCSSKQNSKIFPILNFTY